MTPLRVPRHAPLFWRVFAINSTALLAAAAIAAVVFSPGTVSSPFEQQPLAILVGGLLLLAGISVFLTARITGPLDELLARIHRVDPRRYDQRLPEQGGSPTADELAAAFDDLLERLETEREQSARRTLGAQEAERLRVAQELHDEVGQNLTAALLQLSAVRKRAPEPLAEEIGAAIETVRENLEELRRIAQRLRPQALDELGLRSALAELIDRLSSYGIELQRELAGDLPALSEEEELVIYRVAQEALTNVVRHSGATHARLELARAPGGALWLRVFDDGRGLGDAEAGAGIQGMHERAAAVRAELDISDRDGTGTEVSLRLPVGSGR